MSDFDDLFDFDKDGGEENPPASTPPPTKNTAAQSKPAVSETDDLLDDLLEDFGGEAPAAKPSAPPPPKAKPNPLQHAAPKKIDSTDDLFSDFGDADAEPAPSQKVAKTVVGGDISKEQNLEDLFDESSTEGTDLNSVSGLLDGTADTDYGSTKRKKLGALLNKKVLMGAGGTVLSLTIAFFALAYFSDNGVFGFKIGKRGNGEYVAPSSSELRGLAEQYQTTAAMFDEDSLQGYQSAVVVLDKILQKDARNMPTLARLAEGIMLEAEESLNQKLRKRVESLLTDANLYGPDKIETLRAKARLLMVDDKLSEAETTAKKARDLDSKDADTAQLLGEIAMKREQTEVAREYFIKAKELRPLSSRTDYSLAILDIMLNNLSSAEESLRMAANKTPPHPKSQLELYKLQLANPDLTDQVIQGLQDIITNKATNYSDYDLGKANKYLAQIYERQGNASKAMRQMEEALAKDPLSDENGFYLSKLLMNAKEYSKAADYLKQVVNIAPNKATYFVALSTALRLANNPESGVVEAKRAVEIDNSNPDAYYELGMNQRALRRQDEAIASFEQTLQKNPNYTQAMIELAELYTEKDNFSAANSHLKTLLEMQPDHTRALIAKGKLLSIARKPKDALTVLKAPLEKEASNPDLLNQIARIYMTVGNIDKAEEFLKKSQEINPGLPDTQVALSELELSRKDYSKATDMLTRLLQNNPKDIDARVALAKVLIAKEEFQQAVTECQEGFKYKPDSFDLKLQIGNAWRGVGDLEQSVAYIQQALEIRPDSADALYSLELSYLFKNDVPTAEQAMNKALVQDPTFIEPLIAMGDHFKTKSQYEEAAKYYMQAVSKQPKNGSIARALGQMYKNEGNAQKAKKFFEQAVSLNPNDAAALVGLGVIAEEFKRPRVALGYYEKARAVETRNPKPHYYLGFLYKELGRREEAIVSFRKYLELDPKAKDKTDIEDEIASLTSGR